MDASSKVDNLRGEKRSGVTDLGCEYLEEMVEKGRVFLRGIKSPSEYARSKKRKETHWQLEIRKAERKIGIPTLTKKADRLSKDGNPKRSFTMVARGAKLTDRCGYGTIAPTLEDIHGISSDMNIYCTGYGKKKDVGLPPHDPAIDLKSSKESQLIQLKNHLERTKDAFGA